MSNSAVQTQDDGDLLFSDFFFKKPTRKEQATDRRVMIANKKLRATSLRRKQNRFANIEKVVFDGTFWDKPCLQVDGSEQGLWVDAEGNPQVRERNSKNEGLYFVRVDLDQPLDVKRMTELARKAQAKSSVMVVLRCWGNTSGQALTAKSVRDDVFGDGAAVTKDCLIFEYGITSNTLKVYQPHPHATIHDLARQHLVYANVNGKKTSNQAELTTLFGNWQ